MQSYRERQERIVVTGLGVVSPIGVGREAFWHAALAGKSGICTSPDLVERGAKTQIIGPVAHTLNPPDMDPVKFSRLDRLAQLGLVAATEAVRDSGGFNAVADEEIAVVSGTGAGGYETMEGAVHRASADRPLHPMTVPRIMGSSAAAHIAEHIGAKGPNLTINTACSSGANALGVGLDLLRSGRARAVVAGGVEACAQMFMVKAFGALRALSTAFNDRPGTASRPFDKARDGFILAEGAAMFVLEREADARAHSKVIYAVLEGYGATCDAGDIVVPERDGEIRAMKSALRDAGRNAETIDYINVHATSTPVGDRVETEAIKAVFGPYAERLPVSATKSLIGHTIGASGAIGAAAGLLSLRDGALHPTINYHDPDPACDLDCVPNQARDVDVRAVLVNSFGFGGNNTSLIFGAA